MPFSVQKRSGSIFFARNEIGIYGHQVFFSWTDPFHFSTLIQKLTKLTRIDAALSTFESPILRRLSLVFEKIDNVDRVRGKMKK